jgi:hypothetical protein
MTVVVLPAAAVAASPGGDGGPSVSPLQLLVAEGDGQVVVTFYESSP